VTFTDCNLIQVLSIFACLGTVVWAMWQGRKARRYVKELQKLAAERAEYDRVVEKILIAEGIRQYRREIDLNDDEGS